MQDELISRQALLDMATTIQTDDYSGNEIIEVVAVDDVKALPPVTPQPKIGRWIDTNSKSFELHRVYKCSECGTTEIEYPESIYRHYRYCPNCGAKMQEVEE